MHPPPSLMHTHARAQAMAAILPRTERCARLPHAQATAQSACAFQLSCLPRSTVGNQAEADATSVRRQLKRLETVAVSERGDVAQENVFVREDSLRDTLADLRRRHATAQEQVVQLEAQKVDLTFAAEKDRLVLEDLERRINVLQESKGERSLVEGESSGSRTGRVGRRAQELEIVVERLQRVVRRMQADMKRKDAALAAHAVTVNECQRLRTQLVTAQEGRGARAGNDPAQRGRNSWRGDAPASGEAEREQAVLLRDAAKAEIRAANLRQRVQRLEAQLQSATKQLAAKSASEAHSQRAAPVAHGMDRAVVSGLWMQWLRSTPANRVAHHRLGVS